MQLTVFGASGRTGVPLVEQAPRAGHEVTAFVRDASRLQIENDRYVGDLPKITYRE